MSMEVNTEAHILEPGQIEAPAGEIRFLRLPDRVPGDGENGSLRPGLRSGPAQGCGLPCSLPCSFTTSGYLPVPGRVMLLRPGPPDPAVQHGAEALAGPDRYVD